MKKRTLALFLMLCMLCQIAVSANAEGMDLTEENGADTVLSDVVAEETPPDSKEEQPEAQEREIIVFPEESFPAAEDTLTEGEEQNEPVEEEIFVFPEESLPAAEEFSAEEKEQGFSAGTGTYDGPTEWFDDCEDDDALKGYVEQRLNRERGLLQSSFYAGRRLVASEPGQASVYFLLKVEVENVADGERTSTVFSGPVSDLTDYGLIEKTKFYTADLGYETVDDSNKREVAAAMLERMNLKGITPAMRALLADCPYELYWFDKTSAGGYNYTFQYEYDKDKSGAYTIELTGYTVRLAVAQSYAVEKYEVTTEYADAVNAAIENARAIAEAAQDYSDVGKLEYYLDQICMLASYNTAAAHGGLPYGDPWQIIYVFDGDPSTKVVCEGYAKAFAYLCELSSFSEEVEWYTVTGKTTENHMWNILSLNGNNFLVDPTNCDDGAIGQGKQLFLVGYDKGSVDEGYTFRCRTGSISYRYDAATLAAFGEADLNLVPRGTDPHAPVKNGLTLDSDGVWRYYERNLFVPLTGIVEYGGGQFYVVDGLLSTESSGLTLIDEVWYFLSHGQLQAVTQWAEYDGYWFYITNGILDTTKNGLMDYNGGQFLVAAGQIKKGVNGLWHNEATLGGDDCWYYLARGQVQTQYTGLAEYDGAWFYVVNGRLAVEYTGTVYYDGHEFYVVNGQVVA